MSTWQTVCHLEFTFPSHSRDSSVFEVAYLDNSSYMKLVKWCLETISIILIIMNLMWKLKNTWSSAAIPLAIRFWAHFSAFLSSITYFITCNEEQISVGSYQDAKHVIKQHPWCYELRYRTLYIQYFCFGGRGWVELCSGFLLVQAPINLKQQRKST